MSVEESLDSPKVHGMVKAMSRGMTQSSGSRLLEECSCHDGDRWALGAVKMVINEDDVGNWSLYVVQGFDEGAILLDVAVKRNSSLLAVLDLTIEGELGEIGRKWV
ncbi:hypothetical protein TNIN_473181 [Trichonephila inaurata madagascariensis]|uniref:Uncharacterized protein n=1 Tax=Trichonephila inaurata madagascariensis TaxID=2747483 RepID=A0A8X6IBY2_9ARAC|nr:hypothetical protein TNIN_473181 [Trichonephila inaurata madagascariensis]